MSDDWAFDEIAHFIAQEPPDQIIEKHSSYTILTGKSALKTYKRAAEATFKRALDEAMWLSLFGVLRDVEVHKFDHAGHNRIVMRMPRLPDSASLGFRLVEGYISNMVLDSIEGRLTDLRAAT